MKPMDDIHAVGGTSAVMWRVPYSIHPAAANMAIQSLVYAITALGVEAPVFQTAA